MTIKRGPALSVALLCAEIRVSELVGFYCRYKREHDSRGEEQMDFIKISINDEIAEVHLKRGKVNAINEQVVDEIFACFQRLATDPKIRAVILTGDGPFFSFGFDIPEFLSYSQESFLSFLKNFTGLYTY